MKRFIALLFFCLAWIPQTRADLRMGSGLTASDLATHMGIMCWSFNYLSPKPFHKMEVKINYYAKNPSGAFEGKTIVGYMHIPLKPETRTAIKLLIDSEKSTLINSEGGVYGEGISYDRNTAMLVSPQPVEPTKSGKYILWQTAPKGTNLTHGIVHDNSTAYLELELKPTF